MSINTDEITQEDAKQYLSPEGPLSLLIKEYEYRPQQQQMLEDVIHAFNGNHITLIEAGTGIGKSMAYLIPAILKSAHNKERTVVSTNTITLQEQLLSKDIPLASKVVQHPIKATLVKGMGNYLCLRKLEEAQYEKGFMSDKERDDLAVIEGWSASTTDGSLSTLPIVPSYTTWEKVCAESDTCTKRRCPYFQKCHFFNARKEAEDSQLLIVNHSMLFADLIYRADSENSNEEGHLPNYTRVILDEAHHIEHVATEFFADRVSYLQLLRWMGKLGGEKQGKLTLLNEKFLSHFRKNMPPEASSIHSRLTIDLPGMRRNLLLQIGETFDAFALFLQEQGLIANEHTAGEAKLRILSKHSASHFWTNEITPRAASLIEQMRRYIQTISSIDQDIRNLENSNLPDQTEGIRHDIAAYSSRLEKATENIEKMISFDHPQSKVLWIEAKPLKTLTSINLVKADIDISKKIRQFLFQKFPTTVLCSATLATNRDFTFVRERLGLQENEFPNKTIAEKIYLSPFDYLKQSLLIIPSDMPEPSSPEFCAAASEKIWISIQASKGNAFILFTSYTMMQTCYEILLPKLEEKRFPIYKQGGANRITLLEQYKQNRHAVLFGTDSFWEGVDVAGEALKCVIIVKLPFRVPSEPIIQARTEAIAARGDDPFYDYSVPSAIVKFKQGFGRLIRNKRDKGCVVCLDHRLIKKPYGRLFLNSLPPCRWLSPNSGEEMQKLMDQYYKKI